MKLLLSDDECEVLAMADGIQQGDIEESAKASPELVAALVALGFLAGMRRNEETFITITDSGREAVRRMQSLSKAN